MGSIDSDSLLKAYDFARCQRPDGSYYGTSGKCRKGTEADPKEKSNSSPVSPPKEAVKPKTKGKKTTPKEKSNPGPVPPSEDVAKLTDKAKGYTYGQPWTKDHQAVWDRILSAENTKKLGSIVRKLEKEVFDDEVYDVSPGTLKGFKATMREWLEVNQRSGIGVKAAKALEAMTPEQRKQEAFRRRVEAGIKSGAVKGRMR